MSVLVVTAGNCRGASQAEVVVAAVHSLEDHILVNSLAASANAVASQILDPENSPLAWDL